MDLAEDVLTAAQTIRDQVRGPIPDDPRGLIDRQIALDVGVVESLRQEIEAVDGHFQRLREELNTTKVQLETSPLPPSGQYHLSIEIDRQLITASWQRVLAIRELRERCHQVTASLLALLYQRAQLQ